MQRAQRAGRSTSPSARKSSSVRSRLASPPRRQATRYAPSLPLSIRPAPQLTPAQASIATSVLGGMSTLAASYLAKARGSGEPEASDAMVAELASFVRDCSACVLDRGHLVGGAHDDVVREFRERFEAILGNRPKGLGERLKERFGHAHEHAGAGV